MILNKKYTKYEYEDFKKDFLQKLATNKQEFRRQLNNLKTQIFHRNLQIINSENCTGDFIVNSKNIQNGFNATESEDCINIFNSDRLKNCYDNFCNDKSEMCIECDTSYESYNSMFCTYFVGGKNLQYCDQCMFLQNCFGCIGLKHQSHMILNKKYSEADYKALIKKIKEHMKHTGEYGKPFPATLSSFAYNDTVAQESHPLTKEQAISQEFIWNDEESSAAHFGKKYEIPTDINEIDESICEKILTCEASDKNYKIIPQEFQFYKKFKLPIPRISPDERYKELTKQIRPRILHDITCHFCRKKIKTTYPEKCDYKIVCDDCYLKTTY
jgi:hypothetical protein